MGEPELRAEVLRALRSVAPEVEPAALDPGAPLREQVDLDSIDFLRFLAELEARLGVGIPEAEYARSASLDSLVAALAERGALGPR
jgi:acyl carrier protein